MVSNVSFGKTKEKKLSEGYTDSWVKLDSWMDKSAKKENKLKSILVLELFIFWLFREARWKWRMREKGWMKLEAQSVCGACLS